MKRIWVAVLIFNVILCFNGLAVSVPEFASPVSLGSPIESTQVIHAAFGKLNGDDVMYTSVSGAPAVFNAYNLDKNELIASYELEGTKNVWYHVMNTDGCVYVSSGGNLFRYNPAADVMTNLGKISDDANDSFVATNDEKGNIYIGTTKYARIIKYDISEGRFTDMGSVVEGATYVRSINYIDGYLYCGVKGDSVVALYRVKADNPEKKEEIPLPVNLDYDAETVESATWVYTGTAVDDKLVLYVCTAKKYILLIYDTATESFMKTGFSGSFKGLYASPSKNGKSYFISGGYLYSIDVASGKVTKLNFYVGSDTLHGVGWVDFNNNGGLSGEFLAGVNINNGQPVYYDVEKLKRYETPVKVNLKYAGFTLQSMECGDRANGDNGLYIGSYAGNQSTRYDFDTGKTVTFPTAQIEGMTFLDGSQYFGTYTKANLYKYTFGKDSEPVHLGRIGTDQDRPFAMTAGDGKVYSGTVPDYGILGGVISEYDTKTKELKVHGKIIENQSIIGLVYKDGLLYGSTSVWGGLSASVKAEAAVIFVYDPVAEQLVSSFTPAVNGCEKPLWIGGLAFDKNGTLWAASGNSIFSVDTENMCVKDEINFLDYTYSTTTHQWRPLYFRFDKEGRMYININSIQVVDVDTLEHVSLLSKLRYKIHMYDIDQYGNIYYALTDTLMKLPVKLSSDSLFIGKKPFGTERESKSGELLKAADGGIILKPSVKYAAVIGTVPAFAGKSISEFGIIRNGIKYKANTGLSDNMFAMVFAGASKQSEVQTYAVYSDSEGSVTVTSEKTTLSQEAVK